MIGFTAVALIGRVADPVRPYLVAKRTGLPLGTQIAVYIVERLFDFGAMAVIVSLALLSIPYPSVAAGGTPESCPNLRALTHHYPALAVILTRFGALLITVVAALVLVAVRLWRSRRRSSSALLAVLDTPSVTRCAPSTPASTPSAAFLISALPHRSRWHVGAYHGRFRRNGARFHRQPPTVRLTVSQCVLLLIVSGGVSVMQLPELGWFSQIAVVAAALGSFFGASPEAATACAASCSWSPSSALFPSAWPGRNLRM